MRWRKQNRLALAAFITALAVLLLLSLLLFVTLDKSNKRNASVKHTYEVMQTADNLLSALKDAESAQRGYIITHNPHFLKPLTASVIAKDSLFERLSALTENSPVQQRRLTHIKKLVKAKYDFIYGSLATLETEGQQKTIALITEGHGKKLMDSIRLHFNRFNAHENNLLDDRIAKTTRSVNTFKVVILLGSFFTVAIFLITFLKLFNQIKLRRQQEEKLFVQNQWYNQTMVSLGDGVITTDTNGIITFINKSGAQITGWNYKDALGKHVDLVFDIVNVNVTGNTINPATKAMKENRIVLLEKNTQLVQKNGTKIYIDDSGAPIHNSEGDVIGSVLIFRDITEKKNAEDERNLFFTLSIDMIGIAAMDGYFKSISPAVENILGYTQKDFLTRGFLEYIHPDDIEKTNQEVEKLARGINTHDFVNRYRCKDGTYKWIEWSVTMVNELMYAIGRDISERKKAAEELMASHKKFYQILESNPVSIVISDVKTRHIIYVNDSFCAMSGFEKSNLIGKTTHDLDTISTEEADRILSKVAAGGGQERNMESKLKRMDGEMIDVLFSVETIEIDGNLCYIGSFIDITERKKSEENTKRMNLSLEKRVEKRTAEIIKQKKFTDDILNKIPTEIAVYDSKEQYLYVNPKGIESEEIRDWIIGKTDFDYCKLKGLDLTIAEKRHESFQIAKKNETAEWIDELTTEDGEVKYMLRILHPLEGNKKYILTGYDITELKMAEKEKLEYINNLEEMMFITSHKVRHPITQIMGISNLLEYELSKEELGQMLSYVKDSVTSLDTFTRELTMFIHNLKKKT
ncbi:PAS domain S-box protein [Flavobacterium sp. XGLA_31]|uniref:PAS domain S-box protein n=1 Tax=Flavobacterium sp. XGLA_31 TaxID=3447666 RepID=UPI003F3598E0